MGIKISGRMLLAVLLAFGMGLLFLFRDRFEGDALEEWVRSAGFWAPLLFVALFALMVLLFVPSTIMMLAGGAIFGPWWGMLYNLAGASLGAVLAFVAARYIASAWVRKQTNRRFRQVIRGAEEGGWRFIAFTRLVPVFPFDLINYAFGLTRVSLSTYTAATFVFLAPSALAYAYLGFAGREAVEGDAAPPQVMLAFAILAGLALLPLLGRRRYRIHKRVHQSV